MSSKSMKLNCKELDAQGKGLVQIGAEKYAVSGLLPGESANAEVLQKGKKKDIRLTHITVESPLRVKPPCDAFLKCGGCQLQHLSYDAQLMFKQTQVEKWLKHFGPVEPIIGMSDPKHYRNKVHATFTYDKKGQIVSGIYAADSHQVVQISNCMIQDERANAIVATLTEMLPSFKIKPYDEDRQRGFLRHVLVRTGHYSGEIMVVLVTAERIFPAHNAFIKSLLQKHPEITTIVQNINDRKTSMVLGHQEFVLYGNGTIEDTLCNTKFRLSPKSFYQINAVQTEILYGKAIEFAQLSGAETVLDAYCGIGTIASIASKSAKEVVGVELNKDAVKDAIANAKRNGLKNVRFYEGDAGEFMRVVASDKQSIDVVFMDPPRSGSDEAFLTSLVKLSPKKIIYVSCNPETLARDIRYLTARGYKVQVIQPVDMFGFSYHVETCCLLRRQYS